MHLMKKVGITFAIFIVISVLAACDDNVNNEKESTNSEKEQEEVDNQEDTENELEEDEETIADKDSGDLEVVEEKPAPEDQGDLNVWIKGEAEVKEDSVVIE